MSLLNKRSEFRDQLSILTSNPSDFNINLPPTQSKLVDYVGAVVQEVIDNPTAELSTILSPEIDNNRFNQLYFEIRSYFIKSKPTDRTDKFILSSIDSLVTIDATTGRVIGRIENLRRGTHYPGRANQGIGGYIDGLFYFIAQTNPESNNYFITSVDVDTLEMIPLVDVGNVEVTTVMCYGSKITFADKSGYLREYNTITETFKELAHFTHNQFNGINIAPHTTGILVSRGYDRADALYYYNYDSGEQTIVANSTSLNRLYRNAQMVDSQRVIWSEHDYLRLGQFNSNYSELNVVQSAGSTGSGISTRRNNIGIVAENGDVYVFRLGEIIHYNHDLTIEIDRADIVPSQLTSIYSAFYSDDNYIYANDANWLVKIDPNDLTIVWQKHSLDDLDIPTGTSKGILGTAPLRPSGGIPFLNTIR